MDNHGMISALRIAQQLVDRNCNIDKDSTGYRDFTLGITSLIAQLEAIPPARVHLLAVPSYHLPRTPRQSHKRP